MCSSKRDAYSVMRRSASRRARAQIAQQRRFADARGSTHQHAAAQGLAQRALPQLCENVELHVAAHQRRGLAFGLAVRGRSEIAVARDRMRALRLGEALELQLARRMESEQALDLAIDLVGDQDLVVGCGALQARRQVRRVADGGDFDHVTADPNLSEHTPAVGDAHAHLQRRIGPRLDVPQQLERAADRRFGAGLDRHRIPEVADHAISHVAGDVALETFDVLSTGVLKTDDQLEGVLRLVIARELGRADEIAEQVGEESGLLGHGSGSVVGQQRRFALHAARANLRRQHPALQGVADRGIRGDEERAQALLLDARHGVRAGRQAADLV